MTTPTLDQALAMSTAALASLPAEDLAALVDEMVALTEKSVALQRKISEAMTARMARRVAA
jgi:hypothetical protein